MKFYIFVQARMSSERLPGKSLIKINSKPLIKHIYDRLKYFGRKKIFILTSTDYTDNEIEKYCVKNKINFFRGSLKNVYKRFYDALALNKSEAFIRITGDSILVDKKIINKIIKIFKSKKYDIVTNTFLKTYPIGLSVEMIKSSVFTKNFKNIKKKYHKEHIFSYYYENKKHFKIYNLKNYKKYKTNSYAIDTKMDLMKIKRLINEKKN